MIRPAGFETFFARNLAFKGDMAKMADCLKKDYGVTIIGS